VKPLPLLFLAFALPACASAQVCAPKSVVGKLNATLSGRVLDFTFNDGTDRRIYSPSLDGKRDLYVYLPPGFDPAKKYPLIVWFHGLAQDERGMLEPTIEFDAAMKAGKMPASIIAAPDASIAGRPRLFGGTGSFYLNSNAGRFEDWIEIDLWNFMHENFPILPGRENHALAGVSMGGFGVYNHAIKYRDRYATVAGLFPSVNLRYVDCRGSFQGDFDPKCAGKYLSEVNPNKRIARMYTIFIVRQKHLLKPLFGINDQTLYRLAADNPIEMLTTYDVKPGELNMFAGYGDRDEFNVNSQVESFVHEAVTNRGLTITTQKIINGRHDLETALLIFPSMVKWLNDHMCHGPAVAP